MYHCRKLFVVVVTAALAAAYVPTSSAQWTEFSLPNLSDWYAPTAIGHLPDGRYVFGMKGAYYLQDSFGSGGNTQYINTAPGDSADPSFIVVYDATKAMAGGGGWGASDLYQFNPSSLTSPTFTAQGLSLQNYSGVWRDSTSLYVGGGNGTGGLHAISYVDLATTTNKVIIDNISLWSCAFARDTAGNLYVGDNDDGKVYKFTVAQLNLAISGSALQITDGTFIHQFYGGFTGPGSLAVDGEGKLWAASWAANGLQVYDPVTDTETTIIPSLTNANYMVATFSTSGQDYVAYVNKAGWAAGAAQTYGYMIIPEPGTLTLVLAGLVLVPLCRRKMQAGS